MRVRLFGPIEAGCRLRLIGGALFMWLFVTGCSSGSSEITAGAAVETTGVEVPPSIESTSSTEKPAAVNRDESSPVAKRTCVGGLTPGVNEIAIESAGLSYKTRIFVPAGASQAESLPAVLVWHGLTLDGPRIARYTRFESLADEEGFLVVFPTGHAAPDLSVMSMGNGWELSGWRDSDTKDDLAFANDLMDVLEADWCADANRVFSAGDSLGAMFTSVLVCELADRLAGAASNSGVVHPDSCEPTGPVPYLALHGTADEIVPFERGVESVFGPDAVTQIGMVEEFERFVSDFSCQSEATGESVGVDTMLYFYDGCDGGVPMRFYVIDGDGHTWPGGLGEATTEDIEATTLIWEFFEEVSSL